MEAVINLEEVGLSKTYIDYFGSDECAAYLAFHSPMLECLCQARQSLSEYEVQELAKAEQYYNERNTPAPITIASPFSGLGDLLASMLKWIVYGCVVAIGAAVVILFYPYLLAFSNSLARKKEAKTSRFVAKTEADISIMNAEVENEVRVIKEVGYDKRLEEVQNGAILKSVLKEI